jgi:hypothetical protein
LIFLCPIFALENFCEMGFLLGFIILFTLFCP